ncbi:hypothetical protein GGS23DRAFT_612257 [Durotheca rogersii]|uniref:uncharacterized protein n=1 Tax=Durotheca rogersii TaxID=419775 RepID=UPI00221E5447|nr:uncharacterized protein GGS23DRAFT_612257 [Durotheca rogersii]KAI5867149.1 hypothetical protein GGS23DRAFT_612257 [Durotheca rogersii]
MAPLLSSLAARARSLFDSAPTAASDVAARSPPDVSAEALSQLGPLAAHSVLLARQQVEDGAEQIDPHKGVVSPQDINNTFVFVLFGIIGAAFVCAGIWFFFWARNGGFHFRENDWDDYKSTVLRRKGPNGTLLSNATPTTDLGGGSVYKDVPDNATEYTGGLTQMTGDTGSTLTGITAGASDLAARERRKQKRERKEREREKKRDRRRSEKAAAGRRVGEDGVLVDEDAEAEAKDHLRAYRSEKPARVGGLNKESEGSTWDGSTNPDRSTVASELLSHREGTPTRAEAYSDAAAGPAHHDGGGDNDNDNDETAARRRSTGHRHAHRSASKAEADRKSRAAGGIRKVYSTADRTAERESERLRAEERRLQREEARSGAGGVRRGFSFQRAPATTTAHNASVVSSSVRASTIEEEEPAAVAGNDDRGRYLPAPGGWVGSEAGAGAPADSDLGTKSYHHVIPGLSSVASSSSAPAPAHPPPARAPSHAGTASDYADEKRKKRGAGKHRRE